MSVRSCAAAAASRWLWIGEREIGARRMRVRAPNAGYRVPFLPDVYFEVTYPNGDVQCVVVEIDMGTLTLRRFARKVQAFETALDDEVFRRHFKRDDFTVLVLTQSRRRLDALRQVAGRAVLNEHHGDYDLSTFAEALAPSAFASATWWDLDGESNAGVLFNG